MKKILSLILVLASLLSFAACSDKEETKAPVEKPQEAPVTDNEKTDSEETIVTETPEAEQEKESTDAKDEDKKEDSKPPKAEDNKNPQDKPAEKPADKPAEKPAEKPQENKPQETPQPVTPPAENKPESSQTVGNTLLADFKAKAGSYSSALSLAEALSTNSALANVGCGAMAVEPGYLTGFDNAEINGFKEGAMFAPMIGTIPFVGYVFILEDGTDASEFISTLKSAANLRWNICTSADEMVAGSSGNKVFFVMSPTSFDEQ